jgi:hypothetical protein
VGWRERETYRKREGERGREGGMERGRRERGRGSVGV